MSIEEDRLSKHESILLASGPVSKSLSFFRASWKLWHRTYHTLVLPHGLCTALDYLFHSALDP